MTPAGRRKRTRRRLALAAASVVLVVVGLVATVLLFVVPASDDAAAIAAGGPVDAVVVLGGSPDERLDEAVEVVGALPAPAPTLVLAVQYEDPVLQCGRVPALPDVRLRCFSPRPATTAGEAAWIASTAADEGWSRVVVVTSDFHVTRTRVLVERCVGAVAPSVQVHYRAADEDTASLRGLWAIATEWPSLLATPWDHEPTCTAPASSHPASAVPPPERRPTT